MRRSLSLGFDPLARPVVLTGRAFDVGALADALADTLTGWAQTLIEHAPEAARSPALSTVTAGRDGYTVASDYLDAPLTGLPLASAVCAVIADLAEAYIDAHAGMRALHCGAAVMGGRLVLFSGQAHAGKSTLMARLSAEPRAQVFCDDVLPIRADGMAVALGAPPRVRLPLPAAASPRFRAHIAASGGLRDASYAYVPGPAIAAHGTTAVPRVLLVLERVAGAAARLHALSPRRAVAHLLAQDMSIQPDGLAHIDRVAEMAGGMLCASLVYDDLEDVTRLLNEAFGTAGNAGPSLAPALPERYGPSSGAESGADPNPDHGQHDGTGADEATAPAVMGALWRRAPGAGVRMRGGSAYAWTPATGRYFHLNPTAHACWHLIEEPATGEDVARALAEFFEDADPDQIRRDVASLFRHLAADGMVMQK